MKKIFLLPIVLLMTCCQQVYWQMYKQDARGKATYLSLRGNFSRIIRSRVILMMAYPIWLATS